MGEPARPRAQRAEGVNLARAVGALDAERCSSRRMTIDALVGQVQPRRRAVDQLPERLPLEGAERRRIVFDVEQPRAHERRR